MKVIKQITLGALVLLSSVAFAQKPKYKSIGSYDYLQSKMAEDFDKITNVEVNVSATSDEQFKWNAFSQELQFDHLNPDKSTPDKLRLEIIETNTRESKPELKSRTTDEKKTYYKYTNNFTLFYNIMLYRNDILLWKDSKLISGKATGPEKSSRSSAVSSHNKAILTAKGEKISVTAKDIKVDIDELFIDVDKKVDIFMYMIKAKKHNYDAYNKKTESIQSMLANKKFDNLGESVEFYERILTESDVENKKAKVNLEVTAATHFNLGVTHFMLKEYKSAIKHLKAARKLKGLRLTNLDYLKEVAEGLLVREELRM